CSSGPSGWDRCCPSADSNSASRSAASQARDVLRSIRAKSGRRDRRWSQSMRDPHQLCSAGGSRAAPDRPTRQRAIAAFLDGCGWGDAKLTPLAGDASFRRYYRLCNNEQRAVLMDAPPPQEDVVPYIAVAQLLRRLGFSAPEVFAED